MKPKNPKLMIALAGLGVVVFFGFVYSISHSGHSQNAASSSSNSVSSYDYQSGDTNTEVLNTVVANQKSLKQENDELSAKNEQLQQQVQQGETQQITAIKGSLTDQIDQIKNDLQSAMNTQKAALASGAGNSTSGYMMSGDTNTTATSLPPTGGMIGSVDDISQAFITPTAQGTSSVILPSPSQSVAPVLPSDTQNQQNQQKQQKQPQLMYQIPDGSTIGSIFMMTATLAEVPVSGRLIAPAWPFKAIIGRNDLMGTNSQMLPSQIAGAIIQGHAVGNMGLGCANLYVDKITYTFNDGHFWVYPSDTTQSSNNGTQVYPTNELGYLALPDGTQCINGLYLTDAPQVLLNLTALGAASNAGNVMANQQISTVSNALTGQTGTNITGSAGKLFGWSAIAGGGTAALNYYQQRVSDVFDAVFLPASANHEPTKLIFNVQQTIPIDYDPNSAMDASHSSLSSSSNTLD